MRRDEDLEWLEDVSGERSLAFAKAHNAVTEAQLTGTPGFSTLEEKLFAVMTAKDRIPTVTQYGKWLYNFWTDADHPRGLLRRTTWAEYRKPTPAWETVLDVDALGRDEKESWVYKGMNCLFPKYDRCLVSLSRGGGDAVIVREMDLVKKAFVADGFTLPEAKSTVSWKDKDTVYVGTNFGPGSLSNAGYPRQVKEWKRGTPLAQATLLYEVEPTDVAAFGSREFDHGRVHDILYRSIDQLRSEVFLLRGGAKVKVDKPLDAGVSIWDDQILIRLRSDWAVNGTTYPKGSLLIANLEGYLAGKRELQALFTPRPNASMDGFGGTKTRLYVTSLVDVKSEVTVFTRGKKGFTGQPLALDAAARVDVAAVDSDTSDEAWLSQRDFLTPNTLAVWNVVSGKREVVKRNPTYFDASDLEVSQHFATSKDGTRVPYFQVSRKGRTAPGPTLISAYGGFEIPMVPQYSGSFGVGWMARGGTYVLANLRGGGEYGPAWHQAARRENRPRAYEDCAAIAEDLVARKVTTAKQLGIFGGSNGGLLTSVMLTRYPHLFGAIVSSVPLTDMRRYHKMLAGASWMAEYGNPDEPGDWAFLKGYSPLHNIKPASEVKYPPVLYTSSTRDDRVHPAHARKMVARLEDYGHEPLYYENIEGGHAGAADAKQAAHMLALELAFLAKTLGLEAAPR